MFSFSLPFFENYLAKEQKSLIFSSVPSAECAGTLNPLAHLMLIVEECLEFYSHKAVVGSVFWKREALAVSP